MTLNLFLLFKIHIRFGNLLVGCEEIYLYLKANATRPNTMSVSHHH